MSEFKKGQLVAVSGGTLANRRIRIFCGIRPGLTDGETLYLCREAGESEKDAVAWPRCVPLEEVEPGAFLACDREIINSLQKERDRLHEAIGWLCEQLDRISQDTGHCMLPSGAGIPSDDSCRVGGCESCWRMAAVKAVKEGADGA